MEFFTENNATGVQLYSILLEATALALAYIEVRHPKCARQIENRLETAAERHKIEEEQYGKGTPLDKEMTRRLGWASVALFGPSIFILVCWVFFNSFYVRYFSHEGMFFILVPSIIWAAWYSKRLRATFVSFMPFFNWISKGRYIIAIGLTMAVLGFIGELFQVIVIFKNN